MPYKNNIVGSNANESNNQPKNGVNKQLYLTKIIDVISQKYWIRNEPKTYLRGSKRIDFIFYSEHLSTFIDKSGITPLNEVKYFDRRGFFLDLRLTQFLKQVLHCITGSYFPSPYIIQHSKRDQLHTLSPQLCG